MSKFVQEHRVLQELGIPQNINSVQLGQGDSIPPPFDPIFEEEDHTRNREEMGD